MRAFRRALLTLVLPVTALAQSVDTVTHDKTFLTRKDLLVLGAGAVATGVLSIWDDDIAKWSQQEQFQDSSTHSWVAWSP